MADDPISAALAPVRGRQSKASAREGDAAEWLGAALKLATEDVPRLLAAVDAALGHHKRDPLYGNAATEVEPGNCPHDPDSPLHFEAGDGSGEWLCEGRPEGAVCSTCIDGEGGERLDWPCPEYRAIAEALGVSVAELTGEDKPDDQ